MRLREMIKGEALDQFVIEHLKEDLDINEDTRYPDTNLVNALHRVIAYYSVPGEYEDGKYDDKS